MKRPSAPFSLMKTSLKTMLENCALPQINNSFLQLNGTSLNFAHITRDFLFSRFRQRRRGGPNMRPPRSRGLTPLDFFFGAICKKSCTAIRMYSLDGHKTSITEPTAKVTEDTLRPVWQKVGCMYRCRWLSI
jgi:hypothetical protein